MFVNNCFRNIALLREKDDKMVKTWNFWENAFDLFDEMRNVTKNVNSIICDLSRMPEVHHNITCTN